MKKIISGKKYDTETAREIGMWTNNYMMNDLDYCEETLFCKKTGEYFLYGCGGARSRYSVSYGDNSWGGGERIIPVSFEAAAQWAEDHLPADKYEAEFGEVPEGDEEYTTTSVRLPLQLHNDLKREAVKQGKSLQALIAEKLAQ